MTAAIHLVHGPPGTGKSTYLAQQTERAVEKHGPTAIAIASLTRTAAHEIGSRVDLAEGSVGTMHAHAFRALERPELAETNEALRDWNATHPALARGPGLNELEDTPVDAVDDPGRSTTDLLHAQVTNHRARLIPTDRWTDDQLNYHHTWTAWKQDHELLDFTDLIERAITEHPIHPYVPAVLLLDEAQDFSALELKLAAQWAQHTATTVIAGDPDQALYAWRGADPDALLRLPLTDERVLAQSHRIPAAVHHVALRWVRQITDRRDVAYHPTGHPGSHRHLPISLRSPGELVNHARGLDGTTMILTSCGYMLQPIIQQLRADGVPFHNPYRAKAGNWNPLRGAGALAAFLRPDRNTWGDQARAWTWDDLRLWMEPLQAKDNLPRGTKAFVEERCREDRFGESRAEQQPDDELLQELIGDLTFNNHPAFQLDVNWWESRLRASKAKQLAYPLTVYRRHGGQALRQLPKLTVGTIHSVKGGEADHVIVAPDLSRTGMYHGWLDGGPARDQIIRMIYVALTRARDTITILDPAGPEHVPLDLLRPEAA